MTSLYDLTTSGNGGMVPSLADAMTWTPDERMKAMSGQTADFAKMAQLIFRAATRHGERIAEAHTGRLRQTIDRATAVAHGMSERMAAGAASADFGAYAGNAAQRLVLTLDTLRERGDIFIDHEAAGCPPVLIYDYEIALDGKDLDPPCNYMLLKIQPPEGCVIDESKRPYIIIDPRAGHGAGIGGFKTDSQVGVALKDGHPVYFVAFRREPEPGQTLASVTRAEAEFVREVMRRHPTSPNPVVTGNCQGGWATLLLAATNPDIVGPICLNGAPVATWSGEVGRDPMRYNGGVLGGTWQPMFWSDLGHGVFDGAHLVMNFEMLNPSRNYFRKYYDLFANAPHGADRFLEFETWWGGFFLLNEAEIRWIVEQLFVGNRLVKNEARLETGRVVDVKTIRAPIIVFASHGDNITPPQQALNWIPAAYTDVNEIRIRGQRIIYMVHDQVGHLGIFVSSKIAQKEHTEVASTVQTIEALAPGLYEMKIEDYHGEGVDRVFEVSFHERSLADIDALDDGRDEEASFAAVARNSEIQAELYDLMLRPIVQASVSAQGAELSRKLHPLRLQRALFSSRNPAVAPLKALAATEREKPRTVAPDNPFLAGEKVWADMVEQSFDLMRDLRDMAYEVYFHAAWGNPVMRWFGRTHQPGRTLRNDMELRALPQVQQALQHIATGGFVEAVVRMLILLADSRGSVRRDRLERSSRVLTKDEPFRSLSDAERQLLLNEQTLIVQFERERAIAALAQMLETDEERQLAVDVVQFVPGPLAEMKAETRAMLERFRSVLGLAPLGADILEDPLADPDRVRAVMPTAAE